MSGSQSTNLEPLFSSPPTIQKNALCRLPTEIRQIIYGLILPRLKTLHPHVRGLFARAEYRESYQRPLRVHEKFLALARTCQALYTELIPFYYSTYAFSFKSAYDLYRYLYMIGPYRRRCVQKIDFWLQGGYIMEDYSLKAQELYEWTCGMLSECVSLRKLGVGVSKETKEGMGKGPVKGLEALRGMGLEELEVRVREVGDGVWVKRRGGLRPKLFRWGRRVASVWEYGFEEGGAGCFQPEVVTGFETRLKEDMKMKKGEIKEKETIETEDNAVKVNREVADLRTSPRKGKGKRVLRNVALNGTKKRVKRTTIGKVPMAEGV